MDGTNIASNSFQPQPDNLKPTLTGKNFTFNNRITKLIGKITGNVIKVQVEGKVYHINKKSWKI